MSTHRRLSVILFCDIESYSALMQESESRAMSVLDHFKNVLETETQKFNGNIIKSYGDGSLCLFDSAVEALQCAVQIQESLKTEPNVPLRIGLHVGDIVHESGDVYGDGINVASRLEQICVAGGIVYSRSVYNEVKNHEEFELVHVGTFSFKNIQEPIDVYSIEGFPIPRAKDIRKSKGYKVQKKRILAGSVITLIVIALLVSAFSAFTSGNEYFSERSWVYLMPFENYTSNTMLDGSLNNVIETGIQQSGYVNILPETRIRESLIRMGNNYNDSISFEKAREIAIREGARVIIKGNIEEISDRYLITAQIVDPETAADLYRTAVRSNNNEGILDAIDDLVGKLRKGLGESLVSRFQNYQPLPEATTQSLEALKALSDGMDQYYYGEYDEAIDLFNKAITLDSTFVWPRVSLGMYYYYIGDNPKGEENFKVAEAGLPKVTRKEQLWLNTLITSSRGESKKAITALNQYVSTYPDDATAWYNLGNSYKELQQYEKAILAYKQSLEAYPDNVNSYINLATIYNILNEYEDSYEFYDEAFERYPFFRTSNNLNHEFGFLLVKMDSVESAKDNFELMLSGTDKQKADGNRSLALLNMYEGKLKDAIDHLNIAISYRAIDGNKLSEVRDRLYLTSAYLFNGSFEETNNQLNKISELNKENYLATPWLRYWGNLCVKVGRVDEAERINQLLESRVYESNERDFANHNSLSGSILLAQDSVNEAIEKLEYAYRMEEHEYNLGLLANAYFIADNKSEKAENLYKEIIDSKSLGWEAQEFYLTSFIRLGEIYENRAMTEEAIKYYEEFLKLMQNSDEGIELIDQISERVEQYRIRPR